jgi:hypothetical protein
MNHRRFTQSATTLALLLTIAPRTAAHPGDPVGSEFQVNSYTTHLVGSPAVGLDGAGGFVVVWGSADTMGPENISNVKGRRYASTGAPVGGEFQVNTYTTGSAGDPALGPDGAGGFVVMWVSNGSSQSDTDSLSIQGQRRASTGAPVGAQFQVNTYTTGHQTDPAVASDGAGGFVVVWLSNGGSQSDTDSLSIQGQRYASTGAPVGAQFQVNTYTTNHQFSPAVAPDGAGSFVVVWASNGGSGSDMGVSVQGQRYASAGMPIGGEFQVNSYTTGRQKDPAVASDGAGGFIVVWETDDSDGIGTYVNRIQGQRYASAGVPIGGEFQVNSYTSSGQFCGPLLWPCPPTPSPAVAPDGIGGFVVVWQSNGGDESDTINFSIQGQRYASTGAPVGAQFQVNTYTRLDQKFPAVGPDGAGGFVVVWQVSERLPWLPHTIQGQRYDGLGCVSTSECDDSDTCTDDACFEGECQQTNNTAPCDDGNVCTAGDVCGDGSCISGFLLDATGVAAYVAEATKTPAACAADEKDKRRARKVLNRMKAARNRLLGETHTGNTENRIKKANAKLTKASALLSRFASALSPDCQAAIVDRITEAQARVGCL